MAPINKALKQKFTYETAYPLKHTNPINVYRQRNNFWKKAIRTIKETLLHKQKFLNTCSFPLKTFSFFTAERKSTCEDLEPIKIQLEER